MWTDAFVLARVACVLQMAPEHFAGFLVPASDIFSMGVTLWEMCHAKRPYEEYTHGETIIGACLAVPTRIMGRVCCQVKHGHHAA